MDTVVSLTVRLADGWDGALAGVEAVFRGLDETFSLYREDSELSRVARRELPLTAASSPVKDAYETAIVWRAATRGAFTPNRPDGVIDLNGIVKAMAIERSGEVLAAAGAIDWCVNAGGDVLYGGASPEESDWVTGIADPADRGSLLASVALFGPHRAVATSGFSERGDHIWLRVEQERHFAQVTVFAPDIVLADVLSTAILAAPASELDDLAKGHPVDVLAVFPDGGLVVTPRLRAQLSAGSSRRHGVTVAASRRDVAERARSRRGLLGALARLDEGSGFALLPLLGPLVLQRQFGGLLGVIPTRRFSSHVHSLPLFRWRASDDHSPSS